MKKLDKYIIEKLDKINKIKKIEHEFPANKSGKCAIMIAGNGVEADAFISISDLRQRNKTIPIEIYHIGKDDVTTEFVNMMNSNFSGIEFIDLTTIYKDLKIDGKHGYWRSKILAIIASKYNDIVFLDSDCSILLDPEILFNDENYIDKGALFFSDIPSCTSINSGLHLVYDYLDLTTRKTMMEFETGQFVVNCKKCWQALKMCEYINNNYADFYRYMYGDKDTFMLAFDIMNKRYWRSPFPHCSNVYFKGIGFFHTGPKNRSAFWHRAAEAKIKFGYKIYDALGYSYNTKILQKRLDYLSTVGYI